MPTEIINDKYFSMEFHTDIHAICKPLFENTLIKHFCWLKIFKNNNIMVISSNLQLVKHHINLRNYLLVPDMQVDLDKNKFYYICFPCLRDRFDHALFDYKTLFNLFNPIYLFEVSQDYYEVFIYGTPINSLSNVNYYLNILNKLENFKFYFKEKAIPFIKKTTNIEIVIPNDRIPQLFITHSKNLTNKCQGKKLEIKGKNLTLSNRELEVVQWIGRGCTIKDIAKTLQLSPRTVEQYLNNVKIKSGIKKKAKSLIYSTY